ncbi:MAG TPA: hypothetical protein VGN38_12500 [Caulobacteraceae bacterium]|jgi:hypothetical protein|nr:hypothetical protein [Caulobacteraceae bacterium]
MTENTPHADADDPSDESGLFPHHPHHRRTEERLAKLERRAELTMLVVIVGFGLAVIFGLLTATGHVQW